MAIQRNQKQKATNEANKQNHIVAYHGTSSKFLSSISKYGIIPTPKEKVWQEDPNASSVYLSRVSLEGSYWTENFMTAMLASNNAIKRFSGKNLIVVAQIPKDLAFADEDNIVPALQKSFNRSIRYTFGNKAIHNLDCVLVAFSESPKLYKNTKHLFSNLLHENLAKDHNENPNFLQLSFIFEAMLNRSILYQYIEDPHNFKENTLQIIKTHITPIDIQIWDKQVSKALEQLTKTYNKERNNSWNPSFRVTQTVGFKGSNKLLAIILSEGEKTNRWKTTHGSLPDELHSTLKIHSQIVI